MRGLGEAARGVTEDEKKQVAAQCMRDATQAIIQERMIEQKEQIETASMQTLYEANRKRLDNAIAEARKPQEGDTDKKVFDRIGRARREAQRECLKAFNIYIQNDAVLGESMAAVRDYKQDFLQKNDGRLYMKRKRHYAFSNLSPFGEFASDLLLRQEAIKRSYMVHRINTIVFAASMHVPIPATLLQPNVMLLGPHSAGKSFALKSTSETMIPKTTTNVTGQSEKADLTHNSYYMNNNKAKFSEEIPPSMLGLEGADRVKGKATHSTAMTNEASRFRAGATGAGEVGYNRNVKDPVTGKYSTERIAHKINELLIGCLNLDPHQIPGNVLSRFIGLAYRSWQRGGDYHMVQSKLAEMPEQFKHLSKSNTEYMRWIQMLVWWYSLMMQAGIVDMPDFSVTKRFTEEVIVLAHQRGVNGVSDARVLDHIHSLVESFTLMFNLSRFFSAEGSALANVPYNEEQFLEAEALMMPKVEIAAFVLSLLSDQYETPVAHEVLSAFSITYADSPYHRHAKAQQDARRKDVAEPRDDSDDEGDWSEVKAQVSSLRAYDPDYYTFVISTGRAKTDHMKADELEDFLVGKLYSTIQAQIHEKPPPAVSRHFLHTLTKTQVPSHDKKSSIPLLVLADPDACKVFFWMLHDLSVHSFFCCLDCQGDSQKPARKSHRRVHSRSAVACVLPQAAVCPRSPVFQCALHLEDIQH